MTDRQKAIELYQAAHAAHEKYRRNKGVMDFGALSNLCLHPYSRPDLVAVLERTYRAAQEADKAFAAAVTGMSATEIVSIVEAA